MPLTTQDIGRRIKAWHLADGRSQSPHVPMEWCRSFNQDCLVPILRDLGLRDVRTATEFGAGFLLRTYMPDGATQAGIIVWPRSPRTWTPYLPDLAQTLVGIIELYALLGRRCISCGRPIVDHADNKCLFEATTLVIQPYLETVEDVLTK